MANPLDVLLRGQMKRETTPSVDMGSPPAHRHSGGRCEAELNMGPSCACKSVVIAEIMDHPLSSGTAYSVEDDDIRSIKDTAEPSTTITNHP